MDNLSDLLARRNLSEPPEIKIIKDFVLEKYDEDISVKVEPNKIVILVNNSALASSIRMNIPDIQKACGNSKRIVIYFNR